MDKIKDYYISAFESDELGQEINSEATFEQLLDSIENGDDAYNIYNLIGVSDSVIRERLFRELAYIENISYDKIYDMWINNVS